MKAFVVDRYGSADRVRASEVPDPEMREDDVLVEIHAAGVNPLDSKIRDGEFKLLLPYRLPLILGNELAGVVIRVGSRVRRFKPGDEVYARPDKNRIGTFAELIAVSEDDLAIKPKSLTMEEAASMPLAGLTAWQALIEKARLKKGQKVLIYAGSGGVGTSPFSSRSMSVQPWRRQRVPNVDLVKRLGADIVIDYRKDRFEEVLRDCDVVLNSLVGETLKKSLRVLKPGGNLISISGPPDPEFARQLGLSRILELVMRLLSFRTRRQAKRHQVNYSFLFMRKAGISCDRSVLSSRRAPYARSWTGSSHLNRPKRRWLTSKRDVQKGKSSSRFDRRSALPKIEGLRERGDHRHEQNDDAP